MPTEELSPATATLSWTSGGKPKTWTVTSHEDESDDDFARRCKTEFKQQLAKFPRDPKRAAPAKGKQDKP